MAKGSGVLWRRWVVFVSAGELLGFVAPGLLGVWSRSMSSAAQLSMLVAGGIVEGAALGLAQALVLRRVLPGFRTAAWVAATSAAAAVAWLLGMLPSSTHAAWSTWPVGAVTLAATVLGAVLLLSIGTAQAFVLPAATGRMRTWIGWTATGWGAGLVAFSLVAPPLWHDGQAAALTVLIGAAGGTAMATVMAGVTGVGVVRLSGRSSAR
jgi:hypothetical protein